jgi:hypothetical protein
MLRQQRSQELYRGPQPSVDCPVVRLGFGDDPGKSLCTVLMGVVMR